MKLVELKCKGCGAKLEVEDGQETVTCPYCRITYRIDDDDDNAQNSGYEFEKGRIKAQQEHAEAQRARIEQQRQQMASFQKIPMIMMIVVVSAIVIISIIVGITTSVDWNKNTNESVSSVETTSSEPSPSSFNALYSDGTKNITSIKSDLERIVSSNKKEQRKIKVAFQGEETDDSDKIEEIQNALSNDFLNKAISEYKINLKYDSEGYINVYVIDVSSGKPSDTAVTVFNMDYKAGIQNGFFVQTKLDKIYNNNKEGKRKIKVKFKEMETEDLDEILNIKKMISNKKDYDITLGYDEYGFVNLITIEEK